MVNLTIVLVKPMFFTIADAFSSILDIGHVSCMMATNYSYLITGFGDDDALRIFTP